MTARAACLIAAGLISRTAGSEPAAKPLTEFHDEDGASLVFVPCLDEAERIHVCVEFARAGAQPTAGWVLAPADVRRLRRALRRFSPAKPTRRSRPEPR